MTSKKTQKTSSVTCLNNLKYFKLNIWLTTHTLIFFELDVLATQSYSD
jgi:hypothetical protein